MHTSLQKQQVIRSIQKKKTKNQKDHHPRAEVPETRVKNE